MKLTPTQTIQTALCLLALAQAGLSHADAQAGAVIAKNGTTGIAACMQCHGTNGVGNAAAGFPRLAGQNADYLAKQLADFKAKLRTSPLMGPIANALSPTQMKDVADYYASLPGWKPAPGTSPGSALTVRGAQLAKHVQALVSTAPLLGSASARGWKAAAVRIVPGVILVVVGHNLLNRIGGIWGAAVPALLATLVLLVGVLILLAPWWLRTVRDLSSEHRERVRIEERSAMITHIHDSVLQTLTLIELAAANEADVIRLARSQERELRQWLFNPTEVTADAADESSFATLVGAIERDIENDYGIRVEMVVVGDCPCCEPFIV